MADDVQVGDKVRLTVEGVVESVKDLYNGQTYLTMNDRDFRLGTYKVEVTEKAKPKVGDKLKPVNFPCLPDHTVLQHSDESDTIVKLGGRWYYKGDADNGYDDAAPSWDTFTLVYLP